MSTKKERAALTRARILDGAFELFSERGFHATAITEVARRSGVASQTVYFTFHSKAELLRAVIVSRRTGPDGTGEVAAMPWMSEAMAEPDQRRTIALVVEHATEIFRRLAPIADAMTAAGLDDPELSEHLELTRHERRNGMAAMIAALARKGPLAVPEDRAVDILDVVQSMTTYNAFVDGCEWTVEQYKAWAYRTLVLVLPAMSIDDARRADLSATKGLSYHDLVAAEVGGPIRTPARNAKRSDR